MSAKAEINRKNAAFKAELQAAMARKQMHAWTELFRHWGMAERTGRYRLQHPETLTLRELRVLVAVLGLDEEGKNRLMNATL